MWYDRVQLNIKLIKSRLLISYQLKLGSSRNIDIWLSYELNLERMPIFGDTLFGHISRIVWPIPVKFFIRRLSVIDCAKKFRV